MHDTIRELSCEEVSAVAGGYDEFNWCGNGLLVIPIGFKPQPDPWRLNPGTVPVVVLGP